MKFRDTAIVTFLALFPLACFASLPIPEVPEPGTLTLIAVGVAAAGVTGYAKKRKK